MTRLMVNEEGSPVFKREETPPKSAVGNYTQRMFAWRSQFSSAGMIIVSIIAFVNSAVEKSDKALMKL